MKKTKQILIGYLGIVTLLLTTSCDKELYDDAISNSKKGSIKEVKFDELLKEKKFKNLLTTVSDNHLQRNSSARSAFENQYGFTISNSTVKVIETDSLTSYTMFIERDGNNAETFFENLVIQEDIFNNQRAAIYRYTPTEITDTEHNSFFFRGQIQKHVITNFTGFNRGYQQTTNSDDCYEYVSMCNYGGEEHPAGSNCTRTYVVRVKVLCAGPSTGGGSDDDFWSGSGNGNNDGLGYPYGYGGGGGASDTELTPLEYLPNINDVVTSPILNNENSLDIRNAGIFYRSLSPQQLQWATDNPNAYSQLIQYQIDNNWSDESKVFAEELMDTSIQLEINMVDIWNNDYETFRNQMSNSERAIFDSILPNRQMWYMGSAYKALKKSSELFPDTFIPSNSHNGKGDALRHALWNAYFTGFCGADLAEQLTTAHEENIDPNNPFPEKEIEMDLFNNAKGRLIGSYSSISNVTQNVLNYLNTGGLRYLNVLNPNPPYYPTFYSTLIPTDQ